MERFTIKKMSSGFSLMEAILAVGLFAVAAIVIFAGILYGQESTKRFYDRSQAMLLVDEGIEAIRNVRDTNFSNFFTSVPDGNYGISFASSRWALSGTSDNVGNFNRQVNVSTVNSTTRLITTTVSWPVLSPVYSVSSKTYLTNWSGTIAATVIGMMVYGDGGATTDAMKYQTFDSAGAWSTPASLADVDGTTTNKSLRAVRVYDSATRNEKVVVSRHFDASKQYIYAQVFNGSTWGNVQLLSSWSSLAFLDVQNFDGTYISNGKFVVVYSDNSVIPKMRTWDGSVWSAESSLTTLGASQIPNFIVTKARSGTNEIMAAFYTQGSDTITQYYSGSAWSAITSHATTAPSNARKLVDFSWSPNDVTRGLLIYTSTLTDTTIDGKIWTANGSGSGSWGSAVQSGATASTIGSLTEGSRPGANEFHACAKDTSNRLYCFKATFSGATLTWTTPSNNLIGSTDSGNQISIGVGFESTSGDPAIGVYSDTTSTPKYKNYSASTAKWDPSATNITAVGAAVKATRVIPRSGLDDIMTLISDNNLDVFTIMWDGTNNQMYSTPAGRALTTHGTNGSGTADYWFDFVWD